MTKLLRSELKTIVKECLVEILTEGIRPQKKPMKESNSHGKTEISQKSVKALEHKRHSYLDHIEFGTKTKRESPVKKTNLTDDPVLNELLADTAQTTLQEQIAADSKRRMSDITRPADSAALKVSNSQPEDLFGGEAAGKWAKLAFFDQ